MVELRDKVVIITGASQGIGAATARAFAKEGAHLVLGARDRDALDRLAGEVGGLAVTCDVTSDRDCDRLVREALATYGRIDVLVNNAGVGLWSPVADLTPESLGAVVDVNVYGPLRLIHRVVPLMRRQGGGQIVNVSSVRGRRALPLSGGYASTKAALDSLTDALRVELAADGIDVILVAPGQTDTQFKRRTIRGERSRVDRPDRDSRAGVSADAVARSVVQACRRGRKRVHLTVGGRVLASLQWWAPGLLDRVFGRVFRKQIAAARGEVT